MNDEGKNSVLYVNDYRMQLKTPEIKLNTWYNFCVIYNGITAKGELFHNTHQYSSANGPEDSKMKIFQFHDSVMVGKWSSKYHHYGGQMNGRLSRLQLWDRPLSTLEIVQQMSCNGLEGNIISWTKIPLVFNLGVRKVASTICPDQDEETALSKCEVNGTSIPCSKSEVQEQNTEVNKKIGLLMDAVLRMQKYGDELKQRIEILEEENKNKTDSLNVIVPRENRDKSCPANFTKVDKHCYYFSKYVENDWHGALLHCQDMYPQSKLLSIESKEEMTGLMHYFSEHKMIGKKWWTDGASGNNEGNWVWYGKEKPIEFFINWCEGEPNGEISENCLHLLSKEGSVCYEDMPCEYPESKYETYFICKL